MKEGNMKTKENGRDRKSMWVVVSNQRENEMAYIALLVFYIQIKMIRIATTKNKVFYTNSIDHAPKLFKVF